MEVPRYEETNQSAPYLPDILLAPKCHDPHPACLVKPVETGIGIAMILTAVPVYLALIYWKNKPALVQQMTTGGTNWLQRLLMILPQDKEE